MVTMKGSKEVTTIKIEVETRQQLRLIAALTDETIMDVVKRLASKEYVALQKKQKEKP